MSYISTPRLYSEIKWQFNRIADLSCGRRTPADKIYNTTAGSPWADPANRQLAAALPADTPARNASAAAGPYVPAIKDIPSSAMRQSRS